MGVEIERKFLLASDQWRKDALPGVKMVQGYLTREGCTVRVRIAGDAAYLTIKGAAVNFSRSEFEYPIPFEDAAEMLAALCVSAPVSKIRYKVPAENGLVWEIDEYLGENAPLFTAEIELPTEDTVFEKPEWLGAEVSDDRRYTNRSLSVCPYGKWQNRE